LLDPAFIIYYILCFVRSGAKAAVTDEWVFFYKEVGSSFLLSFTPA